MSKDSKTRTLCCAMCLRLASECIWCVYIYVCVRPSVCPTNTHTHIYTRHTGRPSPPFSSPSVFSACCCCCPCPVAACRLRRTSNRRPSSSSSSCVLRCRAVVAIVCAHTARRILRCDVDAAYNNADELHRTSCAHTVRRSVQNFAQLTRCCAMCDSPRNRKQVECASVPPQFVRVLILLVRGTRRSTTTS